MMNAIHQISLKIQLGIPLDAEIQPEKLRALWVRSFSTPVVPHDSGKARRTDRPAPESRRSA